MSDGGKPKEEGGVSRRSAREDEESLVNLPKPAEEDIDYLKFMGISVAHGDTLQSTMPLTTKGSWSTSIAAALDKESLFKKFGAKYLTSSKPPKIVPPQVNTNTNAKSASHAIARWMNKNNDELRGTKGAMIFILDLTGYDIAEMLIIIREQLGEDKLAKAMESYDLRYDRGAYDGLIQELKSKRDYRFPVRLCGQVDHRIASLLRSNNITLNYLYEGSSSAWNAILKYVIDQVSYHYSGSEPHPSAKQVEEWMKENSKGVYDRFVRDNVKRSQIAGLETFRTKITLYDIHLLALALTRSDKSEDDPKQRVKRYVKVDADGNQVSGTYVKGEKTVSNKDILDRIRKYIDEARTEKDAKGDTKKESKIDITGLAKGNNISSSLVSISSPQDLEASEMDTGKEKKSTDIKVYFPEVTLRDGNGASVTVRKNMMYVRAIVNEKQGKKTSATQGKPKVQKKMHGNKKDYQMILKMISEPEREKVEGVLEEQWNRITKAFDERPVDNKKEVLYDIEVAPQWL